MLRKELQTARLLLRSATVDTASADLKSAAAFASALNAEVPPSWPPELYDDDAKQWTLRGAANDAEGLRTYYLLLKRETQIPLLIGSAGFKGTAKNGVTEIGYSIVPEQQGIGLGTETVRALTACAFEELEATTVCAHTLPELISSRRVLEKNGFVLRGEPQEEGAIRYEIAAAEWSHRH